MKTLAFRLFLALLAALTLHSRAAAEDIDLYAGGGSSSAPNVLFFLDNSSNWSNNSQAWSYSTVLAKCTTYSATGTPSLRSICQGYVYQIFCSQTTACSGNPSLTQGQVELRALKLVLNEVVCSAGANALNINAGLMMFNTSVGTVDGNNVMPGYIRHAISPLSAQCNEIDVTKSMVADLANIDIKITTPDFKGASSADYGTGLYEAFKYFGGWSRPDLVTSGSGGTAGSPMGATGFGPERYSIRNDLEDVNAFTDTSARASYKSPITGANSCGKNFIILIGNTWPNQEYGTSTNASPNPTNTLMTRLGYNPGAQIYPVPLANNDKSDVRFADEWAKFLYDTDVSEIAGQQNIQTFTIDVYNASQDAKQAKLLQTMAAVGRGHAPSDYAGGYYAVGGDLLQLINALKETLTQIASVNSVFASASLPVSVNAQGTFLNQVFMGVFRPQEDGYQRWAGNMKQYQFKLTSDKTSLFLADATGAAAVDSSSGFILNCAKSFWTADSGTYWQSVTGTTSSCGSTTYAARSKYSDEPDGPLVERGGSGQMLRVGGYAGRNIRTCADTGCTSLVDFNATSITVPSTGLSRGTTSETLVNWARGQNVGDGTGSFDASTGNLNTTTYPSTDPATAGPTTRPTVHGEVVHSRPLAVNYGSGSSNDVVVFYSAGDGMLHAVNGNQTGTGAGNELWAFIAPEHWGGTGTSTDGATTWNLLDRVHSNFPAIKFPGVTLTGASPKTYFFDGSIGGYQEMTGGTLSKLWIYPTMRRGGRAVYAFNATSKPSTVNQPTLLWKFTNSNHSQLGQTWSTPVAIRVKLGAAASATTLVAFGAGYDNCEDGAATDCDSVTQGRGVFVMDAQCGTATTATGCGPETMAHYRFFDPGSTAGRFIADMTAVDANGDGFIDLLYAVDTRGNIWRINTSNPNAGYASYNSVADWPMNKIATVSDWSTASERRKFMYAPSVVMLGTQATVLVGTGDREKPLATGSAASVNNRFYGIRDDVTKTGESVATAVTVVTGSGTDAALASANQLTNVTSITTTMDARDLAPRGWYRNLFTTSTPFEQVVTTPLTIGGQTYFSTFQPKASSDASASQCSNLGTGRAYKLDFQTGVMSTNSQGVYAPDTYSSQGIPPSPVGGLVTVDGTTVPFCIGCTGPTVLSPNRITPKVRPDRKPVYRYQKIDS